MLLAACLHRDSGWKVSPRRLASCLFNLILSRGLPGCLFLILFVTPALSSQYVVNGGFEDGFKGWHTTGAVHLEAGNPLDGKASVIIGPGAGTMTQRMETGCGNDLTVSATIQSMLTNGWVFAVRCLDAAGREVMRVDSLTDM